jgi:type IV pilus assembly protein PilF
VNKSLIKCQFAIVLVSTLLGGCVSQSTVEIKPAEQAGVSGPAQRAQIHSERAGEYYRLGNYAVALEAAQQAVAVMPGHAQAHNMLGIIYMQLREDGKAAASFQQAIKLAPNDPEILNNYGWFVCQRQNAAQSMQYFVTAIRTPLYTTPERAMYNAGVCARKSGDIKVAELQLRAAIQRQPLYGPALIELADILLGVGKLKEAENMIARHMAVVQQPSADALLVGVRIARANGDRSSEVSYMQQLRRRFPDSPQTVTASAESR